MRPKRIDVTMAALDRNGISAAQQLSAAGDLLLNGTLSAGYDRNGLVTASTPAAAGTMAMNGTLATDTTLTIFTSPRKVVIYSDGDDSSVDFQITGTDSSGKVIYETITGPNATSVSSTNDFLTVTNVHIYGAGTGNIEVGSMGIGTMDVPRHAAMYSAGNIATVVFTVYGTDRYGANITDTMTGVNNTTVAGVKNFATITKIAASAAVGSDVEAGTVDALESQWIPVPRRIETTWVAVTLSTGATQTYTAEYTYAEVQVAGFQESDGGTFAVSTDLEDATADQTSALEAPATAVRLSVTAFTDGTATLIVAPAEM